MSSAAAADAASTTATRSTISISVPDDRRDDERWPPVLVRFPLGAPRDDVLRSLTSTRVSSYMGMGANANTTLQRGVVIATPAARYSGVAALPRRPTPRQLLLQRWQLAPQVNASARGRLKVVSDMLWLDTTRRQAHHSRRRRCAVHVAAASALARRRRRQRRADDAEAELTLNDMERQRRLVDKFGSRRRALKMAKEARTIVRLGTSMSGSANAVASLESRAAELCQSTTTCATSSARSAICPPSIAKPPCPATSLTSRASSRSNIQHYLSAEFATARDRAAALGAARATARRFGGESPGPVATASEEENTQLKTWHDACEQLGSTFLPLVYADASFTTDRGSANRVIKTAHFLALMIMFHRGTQRDGVRTVGRMAHDTGVPYELCKHFAEHYCDVGASDGDKPRYVRSGSKKDKLINHALVLMLFLSNFEVALTDVVQMLMVPATKARDHLRYVSCTRTTGGLLVSKLDRELVVRDGRLGGCARRRVVPRVVQTGGTVSRGEAATSTPLRTLACAKR
jgi:hypothetical protein